MKVDHQLEFADEVWTDGWMNEWTWNDKRTKIGRWVRVNLV